MKKRNRLLNAGEILDRLKEFYGYKYDTELARRLKLSEGSAIGNWRRRNTLDIFLVAKYCPEIDLDWLFWGRGDKIPPADPELILEKSIVPREDLILLVKEALENYLQVEEQE